MNYFRLTGLLSLDVVEDYVNQGHIENTDFIGRLDNRSWIDFQPQIGKIHVKSGIKVPDIFSAGGQLSPRNVVSDDLKKVIESCGIQSVQFFPIELIQEGKYLEKFWITNYYSFSDDCIDFQKSLFTIKKVIKNPNKFNVPIFSGHEYEEKMFKDLQELLILRKKGWDNGLSIISEKIWIKDSEKRPLLLFDKIPIHELVVSQVFRSLVEKSGLHGLEFRPLEVSDEEWYGPNGLRKQFYK